MEFYYLFNENWGEGGGLLGKLVFYDNELVK